MTVIIMIKISMLRNTTATNVAAVPEWMVCLIDFYSCYDSNHCMVLLLSL